MRLTRYGRKFHDPWGNNWGHRQGDIVRFQYKVGKSSMSNEIANGEANVHKRVGFIDRTSVYESSGSRFVRSGRRSTERLRR
jgi:hypothetical protein